MANSRLTFCIPTHDGRGPFLNKALHSIFSQSGDVPPGCLAVSISANASQDSTQDSTREIVAEFQARFPGLVHYSRHEINQGFLPNMLRAVSAVPGDYGWLFSSDDCVAPGGVKRAWEPLRDHPGLAGMTVDFQPYDATLTHQRRGVDHRVYSTNWEQTHLYSSVEEAFGECASLNRTDSGLVSLALNRNLMRYQTAVLNNTAWVCGKVFGGCSRTLRRRVRADAGPVWSAWTQVLYILPSYWLTTLPVLVVPGFVLRVAVLPLARRLHLTVPEAAARMEKA